MVSNLLCLHILLWTSSGARVTILTIQMRSVCESGKVMLEQELIEYARV